MAIPVDAGTRALVPGVTGREGVFHTAQMLAFGTRVVADVTPGRGGERVECVPVFGTVHDAVRETGRTPPLFSCPRPSPLT